MKPKNTDNSLSTKVQYGVGAVPYHTHNGIDSPKIASSGSGSTIVGHSHNPTLATVGNSGNLKFQTNDFASGITWDTGNMRFTVTTSGYYFVNLVIGFGTSPSIGANTDAVIKKNGTTVAQTYNNNGGASGQSYTAQASILLSCSANDYIEFYAASNYSGSNPIDSGATQTYCDIFSV